MEGAAENGQPDGPSHSTFCLRRPYLRDAILPSPRTDAGDIDNIVKPIRDALSRHIYLDDRQVERLVVQKFEPDNAFTFTQPSQIFATALRAIRPILYVWVSNEPFEELT